MAAIMLVGIVAYTQLPVSALPEVDYPTIQVLTFYPGASPDVVATTVTAPLERQFGEMQGLSQMTSTSSGATSVVVLQFNLSLSIDVAEEEVQSAINAAQSFLPVGSAGAADLQQNQSCRRARSHAGNYFQNASPLPGRGPGRHTPGAEDLAAQRRWFGKHQRRPEAGGADSGESGTAPIVRHRPGSGTIRAGFCQRESGKGQL